MFRKVYLAQRNETCFHYHTKQVKPPNYVSFCFTMFSPFMLKSTINVFFEV